MISVASNFNKSISNNICAVRNKLEQSQLCETNCRQNKRRNAIYKIENMIENEINSLVARANVLDRSAKH